MPRSIGRNRVRELLDGGAQIVEVLEERQYRAAHLPGAVRLPPRDLTRAWAAELDPERPVVLYCYDAL
ncbi:MAG TPA: rhodanese-like domain-containing protein [Acidimicrobiales bacterium]|nr:rhodanese-like domain-containing protein [Acidimicrobiales bacterium]